MSLSIGEDFARTDHITELTSLVNNLRNAFIFKEMRKNLCSLENVNNFMNFSALELQLCYRLDNFDEIRKIIKFIENKVTPDIMASVDQKAKTWYYEAMGKVCLLNFDYEKAEDSLKRAFESASGIGSDKQKEILKLYILANI